MLPFVVLLAAIATLAFGESPTTPMATVASMGRSALTPTQTELVFDYQGFTLATLFTGSANVSVSLSVVHTVGPGPEHRHGKVGFGASTSSDFGCSFGPVTQAPGAPVPWEAHMFVAAIFDAGATADAYTRLAANFTALPPSLDRAKQIFNFSTIYWPVAAKQTLPLFAGLDPERTYVVYVIKVTEPDWNLAFFSDNAITVYGGLPLAFTFSSPNAAVQTNPALPAGTRRMEFVGDSLTAGYCNLCQNPNTYAGESYAKTWSFLAAQAFGAQFHTAAWSGYGVVRNCNGGPFTMPDIWRRAVATAPSLGEWDWGTWSPDVLVIDLGANDHLNRTHDGPLETEWVNTYVAMVNITVTKRYAYRTAPYGREVAERGPLHVFLLCGPFGPDPAWCPYVRAAMGILQVAMTSMQPAPAVRFHHVEWQLPPRDHCCGHPDVVGDRILSEQLIDLVQTAVGWSPTTPPF